MTSARDCGAVSSPDRTYYIEKIGEGSYMEPIEWLTAAAIGGVVVETTRRLLGWIKKDKAKTTAKSGKPRGRPKALPDTDVE